MDKGMLNKGIHALRFFFSRFGIGAVYIFLSAVIGEHQPFTMYPMYSSFPNYANYYLLQDGKDNDVLWSSYFRYSGDEVKDMFLIRQTQENDYENLESEKLFAEQIMNILLQSASSRPNVDSLRLFRVDLSCSGDEIIRTNVLLYETAVH